MEETRVLLAMPHRHLPGADMEAVCTGVAHKCNQNPDVLVFPGACWTSLLPYTFNTLWSGALNQRNTEGITHFAMIHDDIVPQSGWLNVLLEELTWYDADIVSAVVPIKDNRGCTSTAIDTDPWNPRRMTLAEVAARPETFTAPDILLNTGLWVCKLDRPWVEKVWFRQQDKVERNAAGVFEPHTRPEDWDFSRQVRAHGGTKLYATRKVKLYHERPEFNNQRAWGLWSSDQDADRAEVAARPVGEG